MGVVSLAGLLAVGPPAASAGFPGTETQLPLISSTVEYEKSVNGLLTIDNPDTYIDISLSMTGGQLLYCKSDSEISIRLTIDSVAIEIPLLGILLLEFPPAKLLTKFELKGSARVEYLVTGQT